MNRDVFVTYLRRASNGLPGLSSGAPAFTCPGWGSGCPQACTSLRKSGMPAPGDSSVTHPDAVSCQSLLLQNGLRACALTSRVLLSDSDLNPDSAPSHLWAWTAFPTSRSLRLLTCQMAMVTPTSEGYRRSWARSGGPPRGGRVLGAWRGRRGADTDLLPRGVGCSFATETPRH